MSGLHAAVVVCDPTSFRCLVLFSKVDVLQENARKATGSLYNFVEYEPEDGTETGEFWSEVGVRSVQ